ncbi:NAD-dependent epimerase/dehydratase family protein [Sphingobium terrigena]|uniref:NAD-dependent epimerase/dehydratase family protein n=1 Tax=Sphingobium terrigena TaxID=2304063 RepID=A0A418YUN0_9SPHN|nr:NmrA family NAD(P)-binding protein [Sphingobium terrigena]RJG55872.1 NAD-dependent epimerase/dehydratase family protein [Sphingobium terrigena]
MNSTTITVFGATGLAGGAVARHLLNAGWIVRAATRNTEGEAARALAALGAQTITADLDNRASIREAIADTAAVYLSGPSLGNRWDIGQAVQGINVCDAAAEVGTPHLIYQSAVIADARGVLAMGSKRAIEERIAELEVPATITRPGLFMEIFIERFGIRPGTNGQEVALPLPLEAMLDVVTIDDIGRSAVAIASDPARHAGEVYELAGEHISFASIAKTFSEELGIPVAAATIPLDQFAARWPQGAGLFRLIGSSRALASMESGRALLGSMENFHSWVSRHRALLRNGLTIR